MKLRAILLGVLAGLIAGGLLVAMLRPLLQHEPPMTTEVGAAALKNMKEMNELTVFFAVLTTAATTTYNAPLGLKAHQTIIASGSVSYGVNFANLDRSDISWDAASKTLAVRVPEPKPTPTNVDPRILVRYQDGVLVTIFTGKGREMERRNLDAIFRRFAFEARGKVFMKLAKSAARVAIVNNLKLPLKAVGVDADVVVRFRGEG